MVKFDDVWCTYGICEILDLFSWVEGHPSSGAICRNQSNGIRCAHLMDFNYTGSYSWINSVCHDVYEYCKYRLCAKLFSSRSNCPLHIAHLLMLDCDGCPFYFPSSY